MEIDVNKQHPGKIFGAIVVIAFLLFLASNLFVAVPVGHVAVATLFGDVQKEPYPERRPACACQSAL